MSQGSDVHSDLPAVDLLLCELDGVQGSGPWNAHCPVPEHGRGRGDLRRSLRIAEGDDEMPAIRCMAGCETSDVLEVVSLDWRDLYMERGW
jgi:hypothetical protein